MSIDAQAGERQESVRGRVKEKPEIEIDPSLPAAPSKFPLVPALVTTVVVLGAIVGVIAYRQSRPAEISEEQRARIAALEKLQIAWAETWEAEPLAQVWFACRHLDELVRRPCKPAVDPSKLAFEQAIRALRDAEVAKACSEAALAFVDSRVRAACD